MTGQADCGCADCCDDRPIFLEGGDGLAVELRELAFGLLLASSEPVEASRLAALVADDDARVAASLEELARAGRIDRDATGRVLGAAGLTLADGPHGLAIEGHAFRTWCAFDAVGIPAALAADARIETECAVCARPIHLEVHRGRPSGTHPERLWLAAGGSDMRADFCAPTVLLCSDDHARAWSVRQAGRGVALSLDEAAEEGAANWRSAAATAMRVRETTP